MAKPRTAAQLEELLKKARTRETAKAAARAATPKPYAPREPRMKVYAKSFVDNDLYIEVPTNIETLTMICGGVTASQLNTLGLVDTVPAGKASAPLKGNHSKIFYGLIIHGIGTPVEKVTPWNTRWVKFYDKDGGQSHRKFPMGFDDSALAIAAFDGLFNKTTGTKNTLIRKHGEGYLMIGKSAIYSV